MKDAQSKGGVLRELMQQGAAMMEDMIAENAALREQLAEAERRNLELRAQLASDDKLAELLTRVDEVETEQVALNRRNQELEQTSRVHEGRLREVEHELNDLASLYVASCQLSATLVPGHVVRHICELLEQLVGIQAFVFYLVEPDGELALPIAWQGIESERVQPQSLSDGELGEVSLTGIPRMRRPPAGGKDGEAIAIVPLMADGHAVAVISVLELLPHKKSWASVDGELFRLLSERASGALIAASLYDATKGPRAALRRLEHEASERGRQRVRSQDGGKVSDG